MKVLHILPYSDLATSMIFSKRQIESLNTLGVDNSIYYVKSRFNIVSIVQACAEIRGKIKSLNPDVIHCHYGTVTSFITAISKMNTPLVISFHGSDLNGANDISKIRSFLGKLLSRFSASFANKIVLSNSKLFKRLSNTSRKKAKVIPIGININQFFPMKIEDARAKLDWNLYDFVILFNANNPKVKRLDIAMALSKKLKELNSNYRFEILSGSIDANKIPQIINASNCILVCSDSEGSPTIVKEALACNVPIISNNVGDVKERLYDVTPGGICEQTVDAYFKAIVKLYKNYTRSNGRDKLISDNLTESLVAKQILEVYNSCI